MKRYLSRAADRDRQSRHLVYFSILDALARVGCPVCTLGLRAVERYLDGLAYEQVNDPGVRAVLRDARGFCTRHAWQFADLPHAHLGTAIIYRDIAATLLRGLTHRSLLPFAGRRTAVRAGALTPRRPCPACVVRDDASATALRALIGYLNAEDPECCHRYQASGGLCRPHLAAALPLARRPRTRAMLTATAAAALDAASEPSVATAALVELLAGKEEAVPFILSATAERQGRGPITAPQKLSGRQPRSTPLAAHCPTPALTPSPLLALTPAFDHPSPASGRGVGGEGQVPEGRNEGSGCVACASALAAADDFLCQLAEKVAGEGRPSADLALCNHHIWRLVRAALRAGPRAVQRALAAPRAPVVSEGPHVHGSRPWRFMRWRHAAPSGGVGNACPACRVEMAAAQRALAEMGATVRADETPCCVPHALLGAPLTPRVLSAQAVHLARLVADLDRAIRKHDYRFRDEPWGAAYDAPRRAVAHIAGARGLALRER